MSPTKVYIMKNKETLYRSRCARLNGSSRPYVAIVAKSVQISL